MKKFLCWIMMVGGIQGFTQTIELVNNTNPGGNSNPRSFIELNNKLYFLTDDGTHGEELWSTDGTPGGSSLVLDINPSGGGQIGELVTLNGVLYFEANDGAHGTELWRSDGTAAGTYMVIDLFAGPGGGAAYKLTASGNLLYFWASNGGGDGFELFASDGTAAGTFEVKDINPGSADGQPLFANMIGHNSRIYFTATNGTDGSELWVSDGTNAGTYMLHELNMGAGDSYCSWLTIMNNELYFAANNGTQIELYKSDLNSTLTQLSFSSAFGYGPTQLAASTNRIYFQYNDGVHGKEYWITDGSVAGTTLLKDINPGAAFSTDLSGYIWNNNFYFGADDGVNSVELWKSDGTEAGTVMVKNIHPSTYSLPGGFRAYHNHLFFVANDGTHGNELWKTDGTNAGTVKVTVPVWATFNDPLAFTGTMVVVDNNLYFPANYDVNGRELYKYWEPLASVNTNENAQLKVYPNPSHGEFRVEYAGEQTGIITTRLFTPEGKLIFTQNWNHLFTPVMNFNCTDLPAGLYLLQIQGNGVNTSQRIFIQ
jgi:ELWxxDGT repeat protein